MAVTGLSQPQTMSLQSQSAAPYFHHFSERFDRGCENIADAALRLNNAWRTGIDLQLASQPQDLDVDASIEDILMYPRGLQQALSRKRSPRGFQEGEQQGIFALAQRDRGRTGVDELSAAAIENPPVKPVAAPLRSVRPRRPPHFLSPQHRPDACKQLSEAERFYDVIVRSEFEADDAIDFIGPVAGCNDDRNVRMRSNFSQKIQPVILTKSQIQNDQARMGPFKFPIQPILFDTDFAGIL